MKNKLIILASIIFASCSCNDIVDIYYAKNTSPIPYHTSCPYTLTQRDCVDCATYYISRSHVDIEEYSRDWVNYGLKAPFKKRSDFNMVYEAAWEKSAYH